jgi:hypothetical protein
MNMHLPISITVRLEGSVGKQSRENLHTSGFITLTAHLQIDPYLNSVICRADYATSLYLQKLALTSPTSSGGSIGIFHSRTQAMEFVF